MVKKILGVTAAILIALLAGFLWGAAGRSSLDEALQQSALRSDLLEARGAVLAGRVALYNTNFGDSSQNLEAARASVERVVERLQMLDRPTDVKQLEAALTAIREARDLAAKLDLASNNRAAEATRAIESVLNTLPRP
jgi:hypothetical protein